MKIAMIGHKRIPSREGGIEIVVEQLARMMVEKGHVVDAYNRASPHTADKGHANYIGKSYNGIRIIHIPTPNDRRLNAFVYSVLATFRALFGKYDVIHFHASGSCAMLWLPRLFGIPTVATLHGIDSLRSKWGGFASGYLRFAEKMAANCADVLITLTENNCTYMLKTYGRESIVIPNGITPPNQRKADRIHAFGLEKDSYVLFLSRLVPEKGLHYLIEAYQGMTTDKKLVIAGSSSHTDEYVAEIDRLVAQNPNIIRTGFVEGALLEEMYSNAALYVLPSDVEGMAISLMEAMSYGCCCLVSDIPENTAVIRQYGVSFRRADAADLRSKMEYLLSSDAERQQLSASASKYIQAAYNWEAIADQTLAVYHSIKKEKREDGRG